MKKYISPKCNVIAFHTETLMNGSNVQTYDTVTFNDDYSNQRGWDSDDWSDSEE